MLMHCIGVDRPDNGAYCCFVYVSQVYDRFVSGFVKTKKKSGPVLIVPGAKAAPAAAVAEPESKPAEPSTQ